MTECGTVRGTRPGGNLCGVVILKIATKNREWMAVTDNSLRESFCSVTGGVTEGNSVDVTRLTGKPGWTSKKRGMTC